MSQQSDMSDVVYSRLRGGPVSVATLVRELRDRWGPAHGVGEVHFFLAEVGTCLLHYDDVDLGDVKEGRFVAWPLEPWDANDRLEEELCALDTFLEDENRFVFRKKMPIQPPEPTRAAVRDSGESPAISVSTSSARAAHL